MYNTIQLIKDVRTIHGITTVKSFLDCLQDNQVVILKVGARWCKPCKQCLPLVYSLLDDMPMNVKIIEIDIDNQPELSEYFEIQQIPTFVVYKGKEKITTLIGSDEYPIRDLFKQINVLASNE